MLVSMATVSLLSGKRDCEWNMKSAAMLYDGKIYMFEVRALSYSNKGTSVVWFTGVNAAGLYHPRHIK
jgi:hypothetical protein